MSETTSGSGGKGDCVVAARTAKERRLDVETKGADLLARGVESVVANTLDRLGASEVAVRIADQGALDYVIRARVESAVRELVPEARGSIEMAVDRRPSDRSRPRRSRLYAPGSNPRLLAGIDVHGADCVLLDLEDSVPPVEKASARILVKYLLASIPFPEEAWVRINPLETCGLEDVAEILLGRPHGICLPKAESAADVNRLADALAAREDEFGLPDGSTWIMPIIETATGVLHAAEIAAAHERVVMVSFGAEDFTRDVGALRSRRSLLFARSMIVAAAAAAGIQASDTVFADVNDAEGLRKEADLARELGFDGKGAISPRQIPAIHRAFSPSDEELERARAIVDAAREAEERGLGAVALDGKMIDKPVLARAERLIRYAERLTKGGGPDA
ncbi:aldolase/citrate lyase family protein [Candidatus Bipolaricaulota bacterium]